MTLPAGSRLGPYEILAPLGAGGMGEVYRARDARLDREVAVKVLSERFLGDREHRARFEREARAVAAVSHPNILSIHDLGEEGGVFYAVTELLHGETLRQRVARERLSWRRSAEIATAVADGLAAAHARGVVHRDIKPENVFLTNEGLVKILDFGLARSVIGSEDATSTPTESLQTDAGAILGTVGYMSPEQVAGEAADARSDLFSLGCVLYEMTTGSRAFAGGSPGRTMAAILRDQPPEIAASDVAAPEGLQRIVTRCLEKNANERFQSARDLAFALREVSAASHADSSAARLPAAPTPRRRRWPLAAVAAVVMAAAVVLLFRERLLPGARRIGSVAVLPLGNLTGDSSQEYFADGMTEELIADLSKISALRVPSRTSVMRYKSTTKSAPEIAKELGVDAIVEGSVSRNGSQVRITAQLIDAARDKHLWADTFQRELKDVLALQAEVARSIAEEVRAKLTPEEAKRLVATRRVNAAAYEAFLQGRFHLYRRTPADAVRSRDFFQKSVDADPGYAPAWAGLAEAYFLMGSTAYGTRSPDEVFPKTIEAARKALELDDSVAEAQAMVAWYEVIWDRDFEASERDFRRAVELDPKYAQGRQYYAMFLTMTGRFDESVREVKAGRDLDPVSLVQNANVGFILFYSRRYDEAIEWCRKTLAMEPEFLRARWVLGLAYEQKRMFDQAIAELERARRISGGGATFVGALGHVYATAGRIAEARRCLQEMQAGASTRVMTGDQVALIHTGLGDREHACALLEQGADQHSTGVMYLAVDPRFDSLRGDPCFAALLKRLNLKS